MQLLNDDQRREALRWYAQYGYDLNTIAQHYGLTREQIIKEIRSK